jgi:hypothetical protein
MAIKIYKPGGTILAVEAGKDTLSFTPSKIDLWVSGNQVGFTDSGTKETVKFGDYTDITKSDDTVPSSISDAVIYLSGLFHTVPVESNGGVAVNIQDQTSPLIIASMSDEVAATTLASAVAIDDLSFDVTSATGFLAGQYLSIFSVPDNRFYLGSVISVATNTITVDTPLDFAFPSGAFVTVGNRDMSVNGSVTPVVYGLRNTDEQIGSSFDITRIIISCLASGALDLSMFGNIIGGITNGIVLRKVDGVQRNILNAKTNAELKNLMYDFQIQPSAGAQQDGFTGRMTFGGQSKMGVVVRLNPGEDLQLIVQDDLSSLEYFSIICEGHAVTN